MYIVVGLGNPGDKYRATRHNVGFVTVDIMADMMGISINKSFGKSLVGAGSIDGEKVILAKPQTYMNLSGLSVFELKNWYKAETSNIILIYDDVDLSVGSLRIRPSGSAGTHNGMRSVISSLNSEAFSRIRIGIGSAPQGMDLADYVLSLFSHAEIPVIGEACQKAAKGAMLIITKGVQEAMNRCNC
jgi:PTH1 family peptidyl-tRNA hydrolase